MKIEKNIPITSFPRGKYAYVASLMEAGDSVRCRTKKETLSLRGSIYQCEGYKPVVRKHIDGTWRVWKVKKEDKGDEKSNT